MLRNVMLTNAAAIAIGIPGASVVSGVTRAQYFGVGSTDPRVFGIGAGALAIIAVIAMLVPVARAVKVDPLTAIRAE